MKVNSEQKSEKLGYRCDGNYKPETCPFKEKECFNCKTKGRTIKVCRKKQKSAKSYSTNQLNQFAGNSRKYFNKDYKDVLDIFHLMPNSIPPLKLTLLVNRKPITMEIDKGVFSSLINHNTFIKLFGNASKLTPTSCRICTQTGEAELEFLCNNYKAASYVINHEGQLFTFITERHSTKVKLGRIILI